VSLHVIEASVSDVNLGNDWQMDGCENSGYHRADSGISKGIEIQVPNFFYEGNYHKGTQVYRERNNVVVLQEGNLYKRSFGDSKVSLSSET
jgi:hypothetical protein